MTTAPQPKRIESIDFLKGLAIIFVIATHAFSGHTLKMAGATLYVGQAVPIFLLVAGITSQLSFARRGHSLKAYYYKIPLQLAHLWSWYLLTVLIFMAFNHLPLSWGALYNQLVYGPIGAGGYFIPLMVQHLLFFPLVMFLKYKLNNSVLFILLMLTLNAVLEYMCLIFEVDSTSYRVLYVRYITVAALGAVFADWMRAPKALVVPLTAISMAYILAVIYTGFSLPFIPELWTNHHYPAAFYTATFCALGSFVYNKFSAGAACPYNSNTVANANSAGPHNLCNTGLHSPSTTHPLSAPITSSAQATPCSQPTPLLRVKLESIFKKAIAAINSYGKSSYMIYLFQMIYFTVFWDFSWVAEYPVLRVVLSFPICIGAGLLITRLSKLNAQYKSTLSA